MIVGRKNESHIHISFLILTALACLGSLLATIIELWKIHSHCLTRTAHSDS